MASPLLSSPHPTAFDVLPPPKNAQHEACFARYARLLIEFALGLRPGQRVAICGEWIHRPFALRLGDAAYAAGAGQVIYKMNDPLVTAQLMRRARPDQILLHQSESQVWFNDILRSRGALISLDGQADPQLQSELHQLYPQSHALFHHEGQKATLDFLRRAIDHRLCPVVIAICPSPAWGQLVYPQLPPHEAFHQLAEDIFHFTFSDQDDVMGQAAAAADHLTARAQALDALEVRELRVTDALPSAETASWLNSAGGSAPAGVRCRSLRRLRGSKPR